LVGSTNTAQGNDGFLGGGNENKLNGQLSVLGGGRLNTVSDNGVSSCLGGGRNNLVEGANNYVGGGRKNKAKTSGSWGAIIGGDENVIGGNYAVAMGRKAESNGNNCFAIGLEPNANRFTRSNQSGDFVLRSRVIELNADLDDNGNVRGKLKIDKENILAFKRIVQCTSRRREEALSKEELELLDILEDYEDTIDERT